MTSKVVATVKEVQEYERKRAMRQLCGTSWVQVLQGAIILNGVPHSGVAAHVCNRPLHDGGEACKCKCGVSELVKK